ncbi:MAG TPA: hypothetical protein VGE38_01230 [Nocardioides sp.]|uniref:hypothetical protein n=1 Tax=Nocardioides sp. TaxID=35761 RepID=UPI002ED91113
MTGREITMLAALLLAALALVVLAVVVVRLRRAQAHRLADAQETMAALQVRLDELERRLTAPAPAQMPSSSSMTAPDAASFVITQLGEPDPAEAPVPARVTLTPPAFADAVVRETVVQAAALAHGVRHALRPEVRHRIRFEMKREVKRSRKARKVEVRAALREYRARRRAGLDPEPAG